MEPPVEYMFRLRESYKELGYRPYRWVVNKEAPPWQTLRRPLSGCRVGLVASGGIYVTGQVAFHFKDDLSFRVIPTTVCAADLRTAHFAYDQSDARRDPNVVFPIDTLRGLVAEGFLGELAPYAFSFMGGIYSSRRVLRELAPSLAERLTALEVDLVLLVPV